MNTDNTSPNDLAAHNKASPPQKRELKFLLSIKPGESWDRFKKRVIEALRENRMLGELGDE